MKADNKGLFSQVCVLSTLSYRVFPMGQHQYFVDRKIQKAFNYWIIARFLFFGFH